MTVTVVTVLEFKKRLDNALQHCQIFFRWSCVKPRVGPDDAHKPLKIQDILWFCGIFRAFHYLATVFLHHPLTANKLEEKNAYFSALTYLHASFTLAVELLRNQLAKFVLDNLLFIYLNANKLPSPNPKARKKKLFLTIFLTMLWGWAVHIVGNFPSFLSVSDLVHISAVNTLQLGFLQNNSIQTLPALQTELLRCGCPWF